METLPREILRMQSEELLIMATAEQRLQRLEDESAIRDLAARFADAGTRAAHDDFKALWLPCVPVPPRWQDGPAWKT